MSWELQSLDYLAESETAARDARAARDAEITVRMPVDERERIVEEMVLEAGARILSTQRLLLAFDQEAAAPK